MAFNPVLNFNQGVSLAGNIQGQQQQNQINNLQQGIAQQVQQGGFNPESSLDFQQLSVLDPARASVTAKNFEDLSKQRKKAYFTDMRSAREMLEAGNNDGFLDLFSGRLQDIERLKGDTQGTKMVLDKFLSGDVNGVIEGLKKAEVAGIEMGMLSDPLDRELKKANITTKGKSSNMREVELLIAMAEADPNGETIKGKAALIELGLVAKASKTAAERIAENEELAKKVVQVEADKAAATEGAKLGQQLIYKPKIMDAVKLAEKQATERGEVLTSLQRSQAALPGLTEAVDELKELSLIATSTFGGKLFDAAIKQSGFGSTKGATSRAKFVAIVNNQVLPLLKETFGAAFTAAEGQELKATMGSPDSSPEEKMVELEAFMAQKIRDIETKQRQLSQPVSPTGNTVLSDVDLVNKYL